MKEMDSTPTGWFAYRGVRSARLQCSDVRDQFPCHSCRAGLDGNNLRCRNEAQRSKDHAAYKDWEKRAYSQDQPS